VKQTTIRLVVAFGAGFALAALIVPSVRFLLVAFRHGGL
jgi:hypothetical protein